MLSSSCYGFKLVLLDQVPGMKKAMLFGHLKYCSIRCQTWGYSTFFHDHRRRYKKILVNVRKFNGVSGGLLSLVPGCPTFQQSNIFQSKRQQTCVVLCRGLHVSTITQEDTTDTQQAVKAQAMKDNPKVSHPEDEKRKKLDISKSYTERNFITPYRAMSEYLLKSSDLEGLRRIQRRSPFENQPPINVFLRRDVELKAIEIWGSHEALQRELKKKHDEEQKHRDSVFLAKRVLKEYRSANNEEKLRQEAILKTSGRVVMTAVAINAINFALKLGAWVYTGSHSMFAETIHSFADTCNQLLLVYGIRKSLQTPTEVHPYGYHSMRYVVALISGVGIFFFGTGLSLYHGILGILNPEVMQSLLWGYIVLGASLISEGGTLMVAFRETRRGAKREGMSFREYVVRGQDPSVNVILLEDMAAVLSVGIAGTCMGLTSYTGLPIYDSIGSLLVGGVLGTVASFIVYTNSGALVGRSIPQERLLRMNKEMENDVMIRAIHDVKATDMGNNYVRYKAEIDFDGRELTRTYLDSQDLEALLEELQKLKTIEDLEAFMLKHGENIIDLLGAQIDRIESSLKKRHPEVRHVDLELL